MFLTFTFILIAANYLHSTVHGATNEHVGIHGDQTIGGVHLFEVHSPSGGMGLGLKLLLLLVVILLAGYWCLRQRTKRLAQSAIMANAIAGNPLGQCMIPIHQLAPLQTSFPTAGCSHT